jgi:hypothetical protein
MKRGGELRDFCIFFQHNERKAEKWLLNKRFPPHFVTPLPGDEMSGGR